MKFILLFKYNELREVETMRYMLNNFESIHLNEMDSVKLMNRKECKYTLSYDNLLSVLNDVKDEYFVLDIDGERLMPYESIYFDEPNFSLYTTHQNGKQNRYKVRSRTYALTGQKFLELKFKNNKKRTIKKRIEIKGENIVEDYIGFLTKNLPFSPESLEKKIEIRYQRITLVDKNMNERVTIDLNLSYSTDKKNSTYKDLAIIEVKFTGDKRDSKMVNVLQQYRIKPLSFSKYCLGISQHYSEVKQNSMNIKVREIKKLLSLGMDKKDLVKKLERVS